MKRHLPNALTCVNLLCGCIALTFIFGGNLVVAAYFVGIAAVADFFDGLEMLVGQAALAFELFFGAPPPRDRDDELRALLLG